MRGIVGLSVFLLLLSCTQLSHVSSRIDPIVFLEKWNLYWKRGSDSVAGGGGGGDGAGGGGGEDDGGGDEREQEEAGKLPDMCHVHLLRRRKQKLLFGNTVLLRNQLQHPK